ncbi:MAG: NusG domain II-containing protein [Firmicutes bacterium]|nr:NusG domain II-containing protein [Bacillota bacterium]
MDKRTRFWIILFAALLLLCGGAYFLLSGGILGTGMVADIYVKNELYEKIDLNTVVIPREFDIKTDLGTDTVRVEHGRIAVVAADCRDQICVHQGFIVGPGVPIVCLPHQVVIQIEGDN